MTDPLDLVPRVAWAEFRRRLAWRQGEHVTLLGPTGTGKTTLATQLLDMRRFVVAIGTKPQDDTLRYLRRHAGFKLYKELPVSIPKGEDARAIVWPKMRTLDRARKRQLAGVVRQTLDRAYTAGGWTIFVDELYFAARTLRLADELSDIWSQGRSNFVSLIGCSQRPRNIPLDAYSAASHVFLWRNSDRYDVKRLSELNGVNTDIIRAIVPKLARHDVLYVSTRTGAMVITVAPKVI